MPHRLRKSDLAWLIGVIAVFALVVAAALVA